MAASGAFARVGVVHDPDGPHVRFGVLWMGLCLLGIVFGETGLALVYGGTAVIAATQSVQAVRRTGARPSREVAALGALCIAVTGAFETWLVGMAILIFVAGAVAQATVAGRGHPLVVASATIRCGLFPGFAAAMVATTYRFSVTGAVVLVLLVSAYECGDYLIGAGASSRAEGPAAGAIAVLVATFAVSTIGIQPFTIPGAFAYGALVAVSAPVGQWTASLILPSAQAPAPALRRLDSLLVLAPVWALLMGLAAAG